MSPQILQYFTAAILLLAAATTTVEPLEFVFNTNFTSSNILTFGNATIKSSILTLTEDTSFSIGRALLPSKIPTTTTNGSTLPFSTSFIFSIAPYPNRLPGHGFAFLFVPTAGIAGTSSAQHLGLFNLTNNGSPNNRVLAVEFDLFQNQEFDDVNDNHVGVDLNSLTSIASSPAGFWVGAGDGKFKPLKLNNGVNYQAWIDYSDSRVNVTLARAGDPRPRRPLISEFLNLSDVFLDEMYVGFGGATGQLVESHRILAWSFSNSNSSIGEALVTENLPSFVLPNKSVFKSKGFIVGVTLASALVIACVLMLYLILMRRKRLDKEGMEDWESEYWPHRVPYDEIFTATKGFSDENIIGFGGNGKVYKGVLVGIGVQVAVKRISINSEHGMREFLAEVSSLGRLKHRNLVGLRGWCKKEKGSMILVYDYMENGSLDKRVFDCNETMMLSWGERLKALKDVATGVLYLHDGWEAKVLHRDIKASNVLLDKDMNARLGDFGLARMHQHGQAASTTLVVGTVGYMAPEVVQTGRASVQTDVFGFGVLILEVVCGRPPIKEGKLGLVDWVWRLMERGDLVSALDERLRAKGGYENEEVERVLHLGLLCAYPDAKVRPVMRQVVRILEGPVEGTESEGDGMEAPLLDRIKSIAMWSKHNRNVGGAHPTFDEIQRVTYSSSSLTSSDILLEGR